MGLLDRLRGRGGPRRAPHPPPVRVAVAMHQPEAEMLVAMLADAGIPAMARRTTFDVPDMLAAGPREILVPAARELEARALLDPWPEGGDAGPDAPYPDWTRGPQ
jgi:hypothetical protein